MAVTTANIAVDDTDWVLLFTASAADPRVILGVFAQGNLLVHVGADPGAADASRAGRLVVPGYGRGGQIDLTLDDGDTVHGRLDRGSGRVTVAG